MHARTVSLAATSLLLLLAACDNTEPKTGAVTNPDVRTAQSEHAPPPSATPPLGPPVLSLATAQIGEKGQAARGIILSADGVVTVMGNKVGSVSIDGKLSSADGQVMMIVDAEGKITSPEGKALPLHLTASGAAIDGPDGQSMTIDFGADGSVAIVTRDQAGQAVAPPEGQTPPPPMEAQGCTGAMAKTCGLAFAAYMMLVGAGAPPPGDAPAPAP